MPTSNSPFWYGQIVDDLVWKDNELLHGRNSFSANSLGDRFIWKCGINIGFKK